MRGPVSIKRRLNLAARAPFSLVLMSERIRIGTAGWATPRQHAACFPTGGSILSRYSARLPAVEINTSFYRSHRASTWARWAQETPNGFAFAVKAPKAVTHEAKLRDVRPLLELFRDEIAHLGPRLEVVLFQLPPSLTFNPDIAATFLEAWRTLYDGFTALEPRHASWLDADELLIQHRVARVAADPPSVQAFAKPGGWRGLSYWRWHGSACGRSPSQF